VDVKPLIEALIKQIPEEKRAPLLACVEKIKAAVADEPTDLVTAALQVFALTMLGPEADPEAITAVEPAVTEEP
jgi:hypothetical protein